MLRRPETELFEPTTFNYPRGYFQAQVEFASRVTQLGLAKSMSAALLDFTALYRRIAGGNPKGAELDPRWVELNSQIATTGNDPFLVTERIWQMYTSDPSNAYHETPNPDDGRHIGSFIYKPAVDNNTGVQKIELHFNNHGRGRGKSDYAREFRAEREQDLRQLFQAIRDRMRSDPNFTPEFATLGSWMNNFPLFKDLLPTDFVASGRNLYPPELSFRGDSLWGQFLTNNGGVNQERFCQFQNNLATAGDMRQLVDSFPVPVRLFRGPIKSFFDKYGIK